MKNENEIIRPKMHKCEQEGRRHFIRKLWDGHLKVIDAHNGHVHYITAYKCPYCGKFIDE